MKLINYQYLFLTGLGVLLVIVIGIGYRCTPPGHEPCHVLFNLGDNWMHSSGATGSHAHRMRQRMTDRNQWLGGEF